MLTRARESIPNDTSISYERADLDTTELPSDGYDLVFSVEYPTLTVKKRGFAHDDERTRYWPLDDYRYHHESSREDMW